MELVDIPVPDGTAEAYVARPGSGGGPGVLFFMDAIGIRPQIASMCDRIAGWGYVVLAPNVFYRDGDVAAIAPREDLRDAEARKAHFKKAMPRVNRLTPDRSGPDIAAYLTALRGLPGVGEGPVGVTGYCMGARLAVRAATAHPEQVAACGAFHGGRLVTDDPDSPHAGLGNARAQFVFGHADKDASMPPEAVAALGTALTEHGLTATNEIYPNAEHGYTMADTSQYQEAGSERHYVELEALLSRAL